MNDKDKHELEAKETEKVSGGVDDKEELKDFANKSRVMMAYGLKSPTQELEEIIRKKEQKNEEVKPLTPEDPKDN